MNDFDKIYWLLDVRFDFLIPSFMEEYGIKKEDLVVVNSFHGRNREYVGYGKIITLKSDRWKDKEGVVQEEPDDLNRLFVENENLESELNAGKKIFVAAFTGVGLPEHENLVTFTSTGKIAEYANNKIEQISFFKKNKISSPGTTSYKDKEKLLNSNRLKKEKRAILKSPFLSGGYRMKIVASREELKKSVEEIGDLNDNNELLLGEYIEHEISYATMGVIGTDGTVHVFEAIDEQILHEEIHYEGLLYQNYLSVDLKERFLSSTERVGRGLSEKGYRGFFNLDFVVDNDSRPYVVEINARITFGTILIALLYEEYNIWKLLKGESLNGEILPKRIRKPEDKYVIIIGKLKARQGVVYGKIPSRSDVISWWKEGKEGASFENVFIDSGETFLYGSYVGIFGKKYSKSESRRTILNDFHQIMMRQYQDRKKLLGMYIDNYKGFEQANIWFSAVHDERIFISYENSKFNADFKKFDNSLTDTFFGNTVSGISALVGEGGSGKTTILWLICHWMGELANGIIPEQTGAVIIEERNRQGIFAFSNREERDVSGINADIKHYHCADMRVFTDDIKLIYYSNTVAGRMFENEITKDISVTNKLRRVYNKMSFKESSVDLIEKYLEQQQENLTKIMLLKEYPHGNRVLKVIVTKFNSDEWENLFDEIIPEMREVFRIAEQSKASQIAQELLKSLIGYLYQDYDVEQRDKFSREIGAFLRMVRGSSDSSTFISSLKDLINGCLPQKTAIEYRNIFINLVESIFRLFKDSEIEGWGYDKKESTETEYVFRYCIDNEDVPDFKNLWKYYNAYKKNEKSERLYLKLKWDLEYLGSGEMNNLGLFADLLPENIESKEGENIWMLLDEPDNALSPEISRRFVSDYISFCEDQYSGSHVQTWMTTNSPIVLSDIPAQYVRYLKSENRRKSIELGTERTFIANIYELLQNGYFLDKAVGEFALNKVNRLTYELKDIELDILAGKKEKEIFEKLDNIEKQIELISEMGTRYSLKRSLKRCRNLLEG